MRLLHQLIPGIVAEACSLPPEIPGPSANRLLGPLANLQAYASNPLGYASQAFERYGKVVALVRRGGVRVLNPRKDCPGIVLAYGPEAGREVTLNHEAFGKTFLSGTLFPLNKTGARMNPLRTFGAGLFSVNSTEHRRQRQLLSGAFSRARLETYSQTMGELVQRELADWQIGEVRNIAEDLRLLTFKIVTSTLFGSDLAEGKALAGGVLQRMIQVMASPLTRVLPYDLPGLPYRNFVNLAAQLEDEVRSVIHALRQGGGQEASLMAAMVQAKDEGNEVGLTDEELVGHASVLFSAGHETTSNGLSWTLLLLSQHPEVYAHLVEELQGELKGEAPTVAQLATMPLLDAVVKESLRILPTAPWNGRVMRQSAHLGGYLLPEQTEVLFSIYHTHHDPTLYPEPRSFRPARWDNLSPSPFEYCPFSSGPRTCIGAAFATMEMKIVLSILLQRYQLTCVPRQRIDRQVELTISPKQGIKMRIAPVSAGPPQPGGVRGDIRETVDLPS